MIRDGRLGQKIKPVLLLLWLAGLVLLIAGWWQSGLALGDVPALLEGWLRQFGLVNAALCYILLYTIRPLVLFPASLLTIASGLLFGPWLGVLFTILGENASANVAFVVARWFGRDWVGRHESGLLRRWDERLMENGLASVLVMRLIFLPFDMVNYACGLTAMRQRDYAIGTFIGILPGLVAFVLLGGAAAAGVEHRLAIIGLSLACLVFGLLLARRLRCYENQPKEQMYSAIPVSTAISKDELPGTSK
jgi:uncharacterized membrane protein YdjX (TVP38/TMEM64 family)